jgi:tyrosyl-tRNA synthetase
MDLISELSQRGLIHDATDLDALSARLAESTVGVYVGFDPTADSLHVGHLLGQLSLRRFQMAGHRPVALAGGATGMIGDPGGRSQERNLLDRESLEHNLSRISSQLERILDFGPGPTGAVLVNNAEWTASMNVLDFLRDIGKHVTVNQMMAKESVKQRIHGDQGLSYTEFSYMLLQANDYRHLHRELNVELQMGGSDQWGNIVTGIDLVRRSSGASVHGLTWPLLLKSDGSKFGKTADGAVWLDAEKTSPYQFRQFWIQVDDDTIADLLLRFSMRPIDDLHAALETHAAAPERRTAQRLLADELTTLVHGAVAAARAREVAELLFGSDPTAASLGALEAVASEIPTSKVAPEALEDPIALLVELGIATSKGDARRTVQGRGYRLNGVVFEEGMTISEADLLHERYALMRRGKTGYHLIEISR